MKMPSPVQTLSVVESLCNPFSGENETVDEWMKESFFYETADMNFQSQKLSCVLKCHKKILFHVAASTQTVCVSYPK